MKILTPKIASKFRGKICLVRVDFNIQNLSETFRLDAALPTIKLLSQTGAKIVLISHRGRPTRKLTTNDLQLTTNKKDTLKFVVPFLEKNLGRKVEFFNSFDFKKIDARIKAAAPKSVFLLENIRLLDGEEENSPALGKFLAGLGDFFINDAFAVAHRKNASVTQIPRFLPSYAGLLLVKEVQTLQNLKNRARKPLIVILGGAKVSDKIGVIENFLPRAKWLLIGGMAANTFLKAKGAAIGASGYEPAMVKTAARLLSSKKIVLPIDFISENNRFLDIGPLSQKLFAEKIMGAKTVFWNGPMGFFENPKFLGGSRAVANAIIKSRAFSVAGGGETTALIHNLGLEKRFGFLSTGGGAMLKFLGGEELPGVTVLK